MGYNSDTIREAGARIRALRNIKGYTLEDVSNRTRKRAEAEGSDQYIKPVQLSRIERGKLMRPPSVDDLAPIAYALDVTVEDIIGWYGVEAPRVNTVTDIPVVKRSLLYLARTTADDPNRKKFLALIEFALAQVEAGV